MKRLLIAASAAVTIAASFAGAAQAQGYPRGWDPINSRIERLDTRIDRGISRGDLTRREAALLRRDLNGVAQLEYRYVRNGLTRAEQADLNRRFDVLAQRIRYERRDPEQRNYRR